MRKEQLVGEIDAALAAPAPDHPAWRRHLRVAVAELDALERPFAACDRERFSGKVSRLRCIDGARTRYASVFDS